jgi:RNA polymerase sigma-54 factor
VPAYKTMSNNESSDDNLSEKPIVATATFHDYLAFQLSMHNLNERQYLLADFIIGNIDEDGYLRRDLYSIANDISFLQNIRTDENELLPLLEIIRELDPPGIGSANLRECLLIQLKRKPGKTKPIELAEEIVGKTFDEFTKKNYDKIKELLLVNDEQLKAAIAEITKLNPKPGEAFAEENSPGIVIPDLSVRISNGEPEVILNSRNYSKLRLSPLYSKMVQDTPKKDKFKREAVSFARQRLESASGFIDAIKQREDTLLRVMHSILKYQPDYFKEGDESCLKPMLLKDIAKSTGLDISTISRVVTSKYVQTDFGTFLLKNLFSEAFHKESGEDVSVKTVKNLLRELIAAEDKKNPINDELLVELLKQKGYKVARRTVAKYREQLGISVARLRKEI